MRRAGGRLLRLSALLLALLVTGAGLAPGTLSPARPQAGPSISLARAAPLGLADRDAAVDALLAIRTQALRSRDRATWLRIVDPAAVQLRRQQAELFASLTALPLAAPLYVRGAAQEADPADTGRWTGLVSFDARLTGWDDQPVAAERLLTVTRLSGRWFLTDDRPGPGVAELWDRGPVVSVRAGPALVLGHPQDQPRLRTIAAAAATAIPRVTAVWGRGWARRVVVVVPSDTRELRSLLGQAGGTAQIAAYATFRTREAGARVVINPATFPLLGAVGRRVVLAHEITHVATRQASRTPPPAWLTEGFADYVGYAGLGVPDRIAAQELRSQLRQGGLPVGLPRDADFEGSNPELAAAYEQAWLAVRLLVRQHGQAAVVRLYRAVGAGQDIDSALRQVLGTDRATLTRLWLAELRALRS